MARPWPAIEWNATREIGEGSATFNTRVADVVVNPRRTNSRGDRCIPSRPSRVSCQVSLVLKCTVIDYTLAGHVAEMPDLHCPWLRYEMERLAKSGARSARRGDVVVPIAKGAVVRWRNGQTGNIGVVDEVANGRARVRFDSGETHDYAWPSSVLERVVFASARKSRPWRTTKSVSSPFRPCPTGCWSTRSVSQEERPSRSWKRACDRRQSPIRLRYFELASSVRPAPRTFASRATRIVFAHQYDDLSSLANSRVEIKEHQVAVVHRVATTYPHRFILADEVGLGKTIEAGLILKELRARGVAKRVLILAPSGIVASGSTSCAVSSTRYSLTTTRERSPSSRRRLRATTSGHCATA